MDDHVDDFDFSMPDEGDNKRAAFRASISGLKTIVTGSPHEYAVRDISASGCALHAPGSRRFRAGDVLELSFVFHEKPLLDKAAVTVKRVLDNGLVGCSFVGLSPRQEAKLDKLVLEVQKRMIAIRKAKEQK